MPAMLGSVSLIKMKSIRYLASVAKNYLKCHFSKLSINDSRRYSLVSVFSSQILLKIDKT